MVFYSLDLLKRLKDVCEDHDVLFIADEIATGFGRTGELFGCASEGDVVVPDVLCLGKALTGGYMTMSAVLTSQKVAESVSGPNSDVPFMHGPTFMANPLACAVSLASVDLLMSNDFESHVSRVEDRLIRGLEPLRDLESVEDVRVLGAIGVVELREPLVGDSFHRAQKAFVENGVWIRPFGKLIYTMPPFMVVTDDQVDEVCRGIRRVVANLGL